MSDKTKRMAEDARLNARMAEQLARDAKRPKFDPRCTCGAKGVFCNGNVKGHAAFLCIACAPMDVVKWAAEQEIMRGDRDLPILATVAVEE